MEFKVGGVFDWYGSKGVIISKTKQSDFRGDYYNMIVSFDGDHYNMKAYFNDNKRGLSMKKRKDDKYFSEEEFYATSRAIFEKLCEELIVEDSINAATAKLRGKQRVSKFKILQTKTRKR